MKKTLSPETRVKISASMKKRYMNPTEKGKAWYNNGVSESKYFDGEEPEGWVRGRITVKNDGTPVFKHSRGYSLNDETRAKISAAMKKRFMDPKEKEKVAASVKKLHAARPEWRKKLSDRVKSHRWVNKDGVNKMVPVEDVERYIGEGWHKGVARKVARGRKHINKDGVTMIVHLSEIDKFVADGWFLGMGKK